MLHEWTLKQSLTEIAVQLKTNDNKAVNKPRTYKDFVFKPLDLILNINPHFLSLFISISSFSSLHFIYPISLFVK